MHRRDFVKTAALGAVATAVPNSVPASPAPATSRTPAGSTRATGTALLTDRRYLDHVLIRPNGTRPPEVPERLVRIRAELEVRG